MFGGTGQSHAIQNELKRSPLRHQKQETGPFSRETRIPKLIRGGKLLFSAHISYMGKENL